MMKRLNILLLAALAFPTASINAADAAKPVARPNILFVLADDWGWGDLSCHGNPDYKTPNLDRLAGEGIDFRQFAVTSPVCSASRVGVMTGRFPARYGIHEHFGSPAMNVNFGQPDWLDPQAPTVAKFLKSAGYRTAHFGKWHLAPEVVGIDAPSPSEYGFDEFAIFDSGKHPWPHTDHVKVFDQTIDFIKGQSRATILREFMDSSDSRAVRAVERSAGSQPASRSTQAGLCGGGDRW
jgi:arylsulfatase A-like enzyme